MGQCRVSFPTEGTRRDNRRDSAHLLNSPVTLHSRRARLQREPNSNGVEEDYYECRLTEKGSSHRRSTGTGARRRRGCELGKVCGEREKGRALVWSDLRRIHAPRFSSRRVYLFFWPGRRENGARGARPREAARSVNPAAVAGLISKDKPPGGRSAHCWLIALTPSATASNRVSADTSAEWTTPE